MIPLRFGIVMVAVIQVLAASTAFAQVEIDRLAGRHLVRRVKFVSSGITITASTSNCAGSEDTVLYLLQQTPTTGRLITRGYNDDSGGLCSSTSWTNNTGQSQPIIIVLAAYASWSHGVADLNITVGGSPMPEPNLSFGGARARNSAWSSGDTLMTKPLRPVDSAGAPLGITDSYIFAISSVLGESAYVDDDSGVGRHATIVPTTNCSSGCHILAGAFTSDTHGNVTVWRNRPNDDPDADGISSAIESHAANGTRTDLRDTDGDGLDDFVELVGVKAASLVGGDASLLMPYQDAHATQEDLFIEIDYMVAADHSHRPNLVLASDLTNIFLNESAWTTRAIRPHVDVSQSVGHARGLSFTACQAGISDRVWFYACKREPSFFDPLRLSVYHYVIAGHELFADPTSCDIQLTAAGRAEIWGNDVILGLHAVPDGVTIAKERGLYLHEIGHNLKLHHNDNGPGGTSCVHTSVMNYRYLLDGWGDPAVIPPFQRYSYSRGQCDASDSVTPGGGCANVCQNRCVPFGHATPKKAPPCLARLFDPANPGLPAGIFSDGMCDCDLPEWQTVNLRFNDDDDGDHLDFAGSSPAARADRRWLDPYLMGDGRGLTARHWARAARKRAALEREGRREGVDFMVNPHNGKLYAD